MMPEELKPILEAHAKWRCGQPEGARADLARADLARANLAGANLARANLARANLAFANLAGANLARANLARANLAGANLAGANLSGADLADADSDADTKWPGFQLPEGDLVVWKKLAHGLARLRIPAAAARTATPVGRKCRAEWAEVMALVDCGEVGYSTGNAPVLAEYRVGAVVRPDSYDPDFRVECSHGIHFYLTREEAEAP